MPTVKQSRNLLAIVWAVGFVPPFLIMASRTYAGTYYSGKETEAWGWFTPNIVPTMGLILGTLASSAFGSDDSDKPVSPVFFALTLSLSIIYLVGFSLIFLLEPLIDNPDPLAIFKRSSLFLGILQGFVTTTLGVFFFKSAKSG